MAKTAYVRVDANGDLAIYLDGGTSQVHQGETAFRILADHFGMPLFAPDAEQAKEIAALKAKLAEAERERDAARKAFEAVGAALRARVQDLLSHRGHPD